MRGLTAAQMAARVARTFPGVRTLNLGIGLPTRVADHLPEGSGVVLHTENGMLNMGTGPRIPRRPTPDQINAGKGLSQSFPVHPTSTTPTPSP
jgi:3-oxoadipate CoA-transferase beta subunit